TISDFRIYKGALTADAIQSLVNDVRSSPSPSGLVAAYAFNEGAGSTVADLSGNGNTGNLSNSSWTNRGKYGRAVVFNGNNSLVTVKDSASLHLTSAMTLEAWVNPVLRGSAWADAICKGNGDYFLGGISPYGEDSATRAEIGGTNAGNMGFPDLP